MQELSQEQPILPSQNIENCVHAKYETTNIGDLNISQANTLHHPAIYK